ncbi:MAG: tetratricopeptide repeat protein [Deltaproteobacteria bacterium]|nr:tetratricopeptide repeat protein [Deltaproteobacteria bacterium]
MIAAALAVLALTRTGPAADAAALPTTIDVTGGFAIPAPAGVEARVLLDGQDGSLDQVTLADAALVASGVTDADLAALRARLTEALAPVRTRARAVKAGSARGRALLRMLHDTALSRYVLDATPLPRLLQTGEYNCLSSAVLYVIAAEGLLDAPRAMISTYHAFARVTVDGRSVDVETTLAEGFDPDRARLFTRDTVSRLGLADAAGAPPDLSAMAKDAVELPPVALVAGIYGNRAVGLLQRGDHRGAAVALDRAARLGQGAQKARLLGWRGAMLANAGRQLVLAGRASDAVPLFLLGLEGTAGATRTVLLRNLAVAYQHLARAALDAREPRDALRWLEAADRADATLQETVALRALAVSAVAAGEGDARHCGTVPAGAARAECYAQVSTALLDKGSVDQALALARSAAAEAREHVNTRVVMWNGLSARAAGRARAGRGPEAEQDWREAAPWADGPSPTTVERRVADCWMGVARTAHDAGRPEDARAALRRALSLAPDDARLRGNLGSITTNQAIARATAGDCAGARALLADAADSAQRAPEILAHCAHRRVNDAWGRADWMAAAREARFGLRDAPGHAELQQALRGALFNGARALIAEHRCADAAPLLLELEQAGDAAGAANLRRGCPP